MMEKPQPRKRRKKPLILRLIRRGVIFFGVMCLVAVFLYGVGTLQQFTEPTQILLLKIAAFFGLFLVFCAFYGIILNTGFFFREGGFRLAANLRLYIASVVLGLAAAAAALFIIALTGGNSP